MLALGVLSLFGCHTAAYNQEKPLQAMQQSYSGVLPCADCGGLETSLFLQQDGTYILQEVYQDTKDGNQTFASYGNWARTADKLVLTDAKVKNAISIRKMKISKCSIRVARRLFLRSITR